MSVRQYNFSKEVRLTLASARMEAKRLGTGYVGTEHLLLGVLQHPARVARVFEAANLDPAYLRDSVETRAERGPPQEADSDLPYTARAKKVLELTMDEAARLGAASIELEHLLLGLVAESSGIAAAALISSKTSLEQLRSLVGNRPAGLWQRGVDALVRR